MNALLLSLLLHTTLPTFSDVKALFTTTASDCDLGIELFQKHQYLSAQYYFARYIRSQHTMHTPIAHYYAALCAVNLKQPDGEAQLQYFVKTYPNHTKVARAYCHLGGLHFRSKSFKKSIEYYEQVEARYLDSTMRYALYYHMAYAYLNEKNLEKALTYFNKIKGRKSPYRYAANYYVGYISLKNEDYTSAMNSLKKASESAAYRSAVPYLILQVYHRQKQYQKLINYWNLLKKKEESIKHEEEISLLVADAHFFLGEYMPAVQNYEDYIGAKEFLVDGDVLLRTAYALQKSGKAYKAFKYFKDLAMQQDAVGQSASYHTGLFYLEKRQNKSALIAFEKAMNADFSIEIQQEAAFQYAKLSFELGCFSHTIRVLKTFTQRYASTQDRLKEVDILLGQAYLLTNDYDLAITHIESIQNKSKTLIQTYQKATFYKGSEYFNNANYPEAIKLFQKSLTHDSDLDTTIKTHFWLAESLSAQQKNRDAEKSYQQVLNKGNKNTSTYQQALYGIGYAYYNTGQYAKALPYFIKYTHARPQQNSKRWLQDAKVKVADCYYATKRYQKALSTYAQVQQYLPAHAHYQQGVIYGILGKKDAAHKHFQTIFKQHIDTSYYEKSLFELGHISLIQNDYKQALSMLTKLIHKNPHSMLVPDALLYRAIAYVSIKQYTDAIKDYEQLLTSYPTHPNIQNSLLELSKIYTQAGRPQDFEKYLATYKSNNANHGALEQLAFDTAKTHFYDQDYAVAVNKLRDFITKYPASKYIHEAQFLVSEAYYRQDRTEEAKQAYKDAIQIQSSPFYNKALLRLGTICSKEQDFEKALEYYEQLSARAQNKRESYHALEGIMKANHSLRRYEATKKSAALIINQGNLAVNATNEATLFLGKAAMQQGNNEKAKLYFRQLIKSSKDIYAAEAQYLLAKLYYQEKTYQKSLAALFDLNKHFPSYKMWTDLGFLLIAENYIALQELFQAKATLQSIIDNSQDQETIAIAKQKLAALETAPNEKESPQVHKKNQKKNSPISDAKSAASKE